jgi:hypothetical protein
MNTINKRGWIFRYGFFWTSGNFFTEQTDPVQALKEYMEFARTLPVSSTGPDNAGAVILRSMEPFSFEKQEDAQ